MFSRARMSLYLRTRKPRLKNILWHQWPPLSEANGLPQLKLRVNQPLRVAESLKRTVMASTQKHQSRNRKKFHRYQPRPLHLRRRQLQNPGRHHTILHIYVFKSNEHSTSIVCAPPTSGQDRLRRAAKARLARWVKPKSHRKDLEAPQFLKDEWAKGDKGAIADLYSHVNFSQESCLQLYVKRI